MNEAQAIKANHAFVATRLTHRYTWHNQLDEACLHPRGTITHHLNQVLTKVEQEHYNEVEKEEMCDAILSLLDAHAQEHGHADWDAMHAHTISSQRSQDPAKE